MATGNVLQNLGGYNIYNINELDTDISRFPFSIRVLQENTLRKANGIVTNSNVDNIASWKPNAGGEQKSIDFYPSRVVMQDFTGVPAVVDLAAMREKIAELGGDPSKINPKIPVELVIDHSIQTDFQGTQKALEQNMELEFKRNKERYELLKWGQKQLDNFTIVPPGGGIIHQVNVEKLAPVIMPDENEKLLFPDTVFGTDSHTTMVNGLGVLGWGVGGIEAEAALLGEACNIKVPEVIGVKLLGEVDEKVTTTDVVLYVTNILRAKGVVEKFVEYFGSGYKKMSVPERSTLANMAPEYGATVGYCPIDEKTINYLKYTRGPEQANIVDRYAKKTGLFYDGDDTRRQYSDVVEIDLSKIKPCIAGPKRPEHKVELSEVKSSFQENLKNKNKRVAKVKMKGVDLEIEDGSIVIASITSCTNTSNPAVLIGAGLIAKKAAELGLKVPEYVKTSFGPGSQVVSEYLQNMGLQDYLDNIGFNVVGYGCLTCIGNSGPLDKNIETAIKENNLNVASVLSGNRNFEARIHPNVDSNYLASPPLVIGYALAGKIDIDFEKEPIGKDKSGNDIFLNDIWPRKEEIAKFVRETEDKDIYDKVYANILEGDKNWQSLKVNTDSELFDWDEKSTYIRKPDFLDTMDNKIGDIKGARCLLHLGDSVTTDHISPAGKFYPESPAGKYLKKNGVTEKDFNSYGSRRGNHEVMIRGTFANVKVDNNLASQKGGYTKHVPSGKEMFVYEAAEKYKEEKTPLIVIGGKAYGNGSSRDWAAKGTLGLGVKAVIAESYERIHRSNLIGMGVLPLQFTNGKSASELGIDGTEEFDILGIENAKPGDILTLVVTKNGERKEYEIRSRIDTVREKEQYEVGGIMPSVVQNNL